MGHGDHYEGKFVRGLRSGLGKLTHADGTIYEGEFDKGKRHGLGVRWNADGQLTGIGRWVEDTQICFSNVPRSKIPVGTFLFEPSECSQPVA